MQNNKVKLSAIVIAQDAEKAMLSMIKHHVCSGVMLGTSVLVTSNSAVKDYKVNLFSHLELETNKELISSSEHNDSVCFSNLYRVKIHDKFDVLFGGCCNIYFNDSSVIGLYITHIKGNDYICYLMENKYTDI